MKKTFKKTFVSVMAVMLSLTMIVTLAPRYVKSAESSEKTITWTLSDLTRYSLIAIDGVSSTAISAIQEGEQYRKETHYYWINELGEHVAYGSSTKVQQYEKVLIGNTNRQFWRDYYKELLSQPRTELKQGSTLTISKGGFYEIPNGNKAVLIATTEPVYICVGNPDVPSVKADPEANLSSDIQVIVFPKSDKGITFTAMYETKCHVICPYAAFFGKSTVTGCVVANSIQAAKEGKLYGYDPSKPYEEEPEKPEEPTKQFGYEVHYFFDEVEDAALTQTGLLDEGQRLSYTDIIVDYSDDKYEFDKVDNEFITEERPVINVYYVSKQEEEPIKPDEPTKQFGYEVHYFFDGVEDAALTQTGLLDEGQRLSYTDIIVDYSDDKYEFDKVDNEFITEEKPVINVYYVSKKADPKPFGPGFPIDPIDIEPSPIHDEEPIAEEDPIPDEEPANIDEGTVPLSDGEELADIDENETPLSDGEEFNIDENETPLSDNPLTGDAMPMAAALISAFAGLAGVFAGLKKRK